MMFIYVLLEAIAGIVGGILLATRSKKAEGVIYGKLDKIGRITNVALLVVYVNLCPAFMFVGMICEPSQKGLLGFVGWVVSFICASTTLACGLGLGCSVALRKKGNRVWSFVVQFAGLAAIGLTVLLYALCEGSLLRSLN